MAKQDTALNLKDVSLQNLLRDDPTPTGDANPKPDKTDDDTLDGDDPADDENDDNPGDDSGDSSDDDSGDDDGDDGGNADDGEGGDDDGEDDNDGNDEPESIVSTIQKSLGIQVEGEFEDSEEGIAQFTTKAAETIAQNKLGEFFDAIPELERFTQYMLNGGDERKYFETIGQASIENVKMDQKNILIQKQILEQKLKSEGLTDSEVDSTLEEYEEAGILFKEATRAQKILSTKAKHQHQALVEQQKRQRDAEKRIEQQNIQQVSGLVKGGKLANIVIPENEKQAFLNHLYAPIDSKGTTAADKARAELDLEKGALLEYLVFKGVDFSKLVTAARSTQKNQSLAARLKKKSNKANPSEGFGGRNKRNDDSSQYIPKLSDVL